MRNKDILDEIDKDIGLFLSKMEELSFSDKRDLLRTLFKKHMVLNFSDLMLNSYDFYTIISEAKNSYSKEPMPVSVGSKEVSPTDASNLFVIEAVFSFLNQRGALKRVPKFDRR